MRQLCNVANRIGAEIARFVQIGGESDSVDVVLRFRRCPIWLDTKSDFYRISLDPSTLPKLQEEVFYGDATRTAVGKEAKTACLTINPRSV